MKHYVLTRNGNEANVGASWVSPGRAFHRDGCHSREGCYAPHNICFPLVAQRGWLTWQISVPGQISIEGGFPSNNVVPRMSIALNVITDTLNSDQKLLGSQCNSFGNDLPA